MKKTNIAMLLSGLVIGGLTYVAYKKQQKLKVINQCKDRIDDFLGSPYLEDQESFYNLLQSSEHAKIFLKKIPSYVGFPHISHSSDGNIVFRWLRGKKIAELSFDGSKVEYTMLVDGKFIPGKYEASSYFFPPDLKLYFEKQ